MGNKKYLIILLILIIFTCSSVYAEDSVNNDTLTTDIELNQEIDDDTLSLDDSPSEIIVDDDNYHNYFNEVTGKFKVDASTVKTLKVGNVSNKLFLIDKPLNIMPASPDSQIKNGVIHLIEGSDGSNITNLIINNTKGEITYEGLFICKLHGIWLSNSSNNLIFNNTIRIAEDFGCYAIPMGYSSNNQILYNDIKTYITSCIVMGSCNYCNISYNRIEVLKYSDSSTTNLIYFNGFGHADYSGPADCVGTYISNNYLKGFSNGPWSIILNLLGKSDDTKVINNTVIRGAGGIVLYDQWDPLNQASNVLIENNTIINSSNSIHVSSNNVIVKNNKIIGLEMEYGIISVNDGRYKDNLTIIGNEIDYQSLHAAISLSSNANVTGNVIHLSKYGDGISVEANNSNIYKNQIYVTGDDGISIYASNVSVHDNTISTKSNGVVITSNSNKRKYYNNVITGNKIYSDKYAAYIEGFVYNTVFNNNIIRTNQSEAIYFNVRVTNDDKNKGDITNNNINGIYENTETFIINDTNFYDYFDEDGYLKEEFITSSRTMIFFTFLSNKDIYFTDPIVLTSNGMANLLSNVSITFSVDACDSSISNFNFYNSDKTSIILDGVDEVVIDNNDFKTIINSGFQTNTISIIGGCNNCLITDNDFFINSKTYYSYAISISEPSNSLVKKLSRNFNISNNNILIKSTGVSEGIYSDSLVESSISNNHINIMSDGSAYGIAICQISERPYDINIDSNEIILNSKEMSYLIELYRCDNCQITNNYIKGTSNGVYGIGIYDSKEIDVNQNEIIVSGKQLTSSRPADALGKGNVAVYIARNSKVSEFSKNIIDSNNCTILINEDSDLKRNYNSFVISNYNYDLYFNSNGIIIKNILKKNDTILFKNFTDSKTMTIDIPLNIMSYKHLKQFSANLILSGNSNNSKISDLYFKDADLILDNVSNVLISYNSFNSTNIFENNGFNNNFSFNSFFKLSYIKLFNSSNHTFSFNNVTVESKFMSILNSNNTLINNNIFNSIDDVIFSNNTFNNTISSNEFYVNATHAYNADNACFDNILDNYIEISNDNPVAIYYHGKSSDNIIKFNKIISYSKSDDNYVIVINNTDVGNAVTFNYLISSNGVKKGDDAVNAKHSLVCNNAPAFIYVSVNSTGGNGSLENPFSTIKQAVESSVSGTIIYLLPGVYNESNIVIDKNITITAINNEGKTYINASNNQLFDIKKNGILSINALKIFNGFSVEGGSLFKNLGNLFINNSMLYNSSSYYDNTNSTYTKSKYNNNYFSYNCANLGLGGAILNKGVLFINSSTFFDNFAHKGGFLADFGKTIILNSLIFNNSGVHGGAIYSKSSEKFTIENCAFLDNVAVQSLDYCYLQRTGGGPQYKYRYLSVCEELPGIGGAIYAITPVDINNSLFESNKAKYGGAIASNSKLIGNDNVYHNDVDYITYLQRVTFPPNAKLNIQNSLFKYNKAMDTTSGKLDVFDIDGVGKIYSINFLGGAIFGSFNIFNLFNSSFVSNEAYTNGGALSVQASSSTIEGCKFYDNTAGNAGGALDLFGNYQVFKSEIINNSAKRGGAVQYLSVESYDHLQNNMAMFNVTVAGNKALETGGAFHTGMSNFAIKNSNIYDNSAPTGSTFSSDSRSNIDVRNNWWGSASGPDDSIFGLDYVRFRTWQGQRVDWDSISIHNPPINANENDNNNNNNGHGNSKSNNGGEDISTGSSIHTGSTLSSETQSNSKNEGNGFKFSGNWPSNGNNGVNNYYPSNGNSGNMNYGNGNPNRDQSKHSGNGNVNNPNSLSKINSSSVNNLASVGMTSNAADSSHGSSSSSSYSQDERNSKAYEISKDVKKEIKNLNSDLEIFNILFVLLWLFFFIGFYRKYASD